MMQQTGMTRVERIKAIRERDGVLCFHPDCRKPFKYLTEDIPVGPGNITMFDDITFDHWMPRSRGGTWDVENLRLMHKRCNAVKGDTIPNEDGTLPLLNRENSAARRAAMRSSRTEVCTSCDSGRLLGPEEHCDTCGSVPMPYTHPQWAKLLPKDCEHKGVWWCWACMSGIIEREPAFVDAFAAGEVDP